MAFVLDLLNTVRDRSMSSLVAFQANLALLQMVPSDSMAVVRRPQQREHPHKRRG